MDSWQIERCYELGEARMSRLFRNSTAKRTTDTKTWIVYCARNAAGKAVAPEFGLPITDYVWFDVLRLAPEGRFIDTETRRIILRTGRLG